MDADVQPSLDRLATAVDSIFGFIQRSTEPASPGLSWETIDYWNKPHRDPGIFNGVGGISFFLVDEFRRSGRPEALALSQGAIDWCAAFPGKHCRRGIYFGKTGTALAALHRSIALAEPVVPEICRAYADIILREPAGPITDIMGGEASNGLYLLKLWSRTQETLYLRGAERSAEWLERQMTRDNRGTHCLMVPAAAPETNPKIYLGASHGLSGVAHFLVLLAEATKSDRWAALARELLETISRYAQPARGGINWPATIGQAELTRCQWSHGAVGIGLTYLAAYRVFGDAKLLETAVLAAEATFGYGDFRQNYTQCTGLAGSGELLLETYSVTGDRRWKERAVALAELCLTYKESTPNGDAWPTDAPGLYSSDFLCGAAGVGHFFLRVLSDGKIKMPLM